MEPIIIGAIALAVGAAAGYTGRKMVAKKQIDTAEAKVEKMLQDAKTREKELLLEARDKALNIQQQAERDEKEMKARLQETQSKLEQREETFYKKIEDLETKREQLQQKATEIKKIREEADALKEQQVVELQKVAQMDKEAAVAMLMQRVESQAQEDIVARIKKLEMNGEEALADKARNILSLAIERVAAVHSADTTATVIPLPSEDMKGRIIGREGRNIKVLEKLTGIEVVVDETPQAVVISGFSPIRRHVAKVALESLMKDGRIHPTRIEEAVKKAKEDIAVEIKKAGDEALYEVGITNSFNSKLVQLLGRLKFRTSYGQNVLRHSVEAAHVAGILAAELGADVNIAKTSALFHDIGKGVDQEIEGTHTQIGVNIGKKFGLSEAVIHGIAAHHEDIPAETVEAMIVRAADAISASRVGARSDTYEDYIKRLEDLEGIANAFAGVEKTYAIQAGREIRIFVTPESVDDVAAHQLARDIALKVEQELQYPGEIKINVIRETRAVEYAR